MPQQQPPQPPPHPPIIRALTELVPTWAVFCDCEGIFDKDHTDVVRTPIFKRVMCMTVVELAVNGYPHTALWSWVASTIMPVANDLKDKLLNFFIAGRDEGAMQVAQNCINWCGFTTDNPYSDDLDAFGFLMTNPSAEKWSPTCHEHRKKVAKRIADAHQSPILVPSKDLVGADGTLLH
jgi:hypothetical protein